MTAHTYISAVAGAFFPVEAKKWVKTPGSLAPSVLLVREGAGPSVDGIGVLPRKIKIVSAKRAFWCILWSEKGLLKRYEIYYVGN